MKMELRCHAVLCKNETKAKTMALQLHQKLSFALKEFQREKLRKQTSRLTLQRTKVLSRTGNILPLRTQLLSTANNFRPPVSKSHTAPKLGSITEDEEDECVEAYEEEMFAIMGHHYALKRGSVGARLEGNSNNDDMMPALPTSTGQTPAGRLHKGGEHHNIVEALDLESADCLDVDYFNSEPIIDLEIGNDLDELRRDDAVSFCMNEDADSDEESAESGYNDQDQDITENEKDKIRNDEPLTVGEGEVICRLPSYDLDWDQANDASSRMTS